MSEGEKLRLAKQKILKPWVLDITKPLNLPFFVLNEIMNAYAIYIQYSLFDFSITCQKSVHYLSKIFLKNGTTQIYELQCIGFVIHFDCFEACFLTSISKQNKKVGVHLNTFPSNLRKSSTQKILTYNAPMPTNILIKHVNHIKNEINISYLVAYQA